MILFDRVNKQVLTVIETFDATSVLQDEKLNRFTITNFELQQKRQLGQLTEI